MKHCCSKEARRSLLRHRDVATCDGCGALLLAYDNRRDFEHTVEELKRHGVAFETDERAGLLLVAKERPRESRS